MDSTKLLQDLLGDDAEQCGPDAQDAHKKAYSEMTHLLRPLPGSRDLIDFLSEHGAAVVLATSAPPEELKVLRKVLDVDELLTAVTDSDDVETAKPEPGIVRIAVDRSGRSADNAVFVGDAIWDMHAAGRAGVGRIGLLTGGISEGELRAAGADQVFADAAALLESLRGKGAV